MAVTPYLLKSSTLEQHDSNVQKTFSKFIKTIMGVVFIDYRFWGLIFTDYRFFGLTD